jgi:ATP-binding cassette subfamily B protein/subfamily B ATP-binding cassette protein MsbA
MTEQIKKVLNEVKPHWKRVIIVAVTGIIYAICSARLMYIVKDIENAVSPKNMDWQFVGEVLGLAIMVAIARYYHIYLMNITAEQVVNQFRLKLQQKFLNMDLKFHSEYASGSGGLMSRIMNDIGVIQNGLRMVADFFREPLLAIFLIFNLFKLNTKLTLSIIIVAPIILYVIKQISKSLRKYVRYGQENLEKISATIKESLDGVRTIQSFNLENTLEQKLSTETDIYFNIRKKVHSRTEAVSPITQFIATVVVLGIIFYFSRAIANGEATHGEFFAYVGSMLALNAPINKFQESYVRIQETVVATERIHLILDQPSELKLAANPAPFPKNWKKIEFRNVDFSYGHHQVLHKFNMTLNRGEKVALVGESGSGKSTIANLLERFYDPTGGEILIDDIPMKNLDVAELRRNIGLVSQDVFLLRDTIENNIWSGDFSKSKDLVKPMAQKAHAQDFISRLKNQYQNQVGDRGGLLSGGEKQRISIARAFLKDAPILILDEATSALDSQSEVEVQKGLNSLMEGRTVVVIAHRLSTVQSCDRIVVLKSGRIAEMGSHDALIKTQGEYFKFYKLQNQLAT